MAHLRKLFGISIWISALLCISFCKADNQPRPETVSQSRIIVGVILPLTGNGAAWGAGIKAGLLLAYKRLTPALQSRIRLLFEDDELKSQKAVAAYLNLVKTRGIDVLINATTVTGFALAPLAERDQIPFIAIASDRRISADKKFVINLWVAADQQARVAVEEALRRGYRRIARVTALTEGTLARKRLFDNFSAEKITAVVDEEYSLDEMDFRSVISKVAAQSDLDAVSLMLGPTQCGVFARQLREKGVLLPLFGYECFADPSEHKLANGALRGQWYADSGPLNPAFMREFKKLSGQYSPVIVANGYDALLLIAEGVKVEPSSMAINRALHTVKDFEGALGTYSATGSNDFSLPVIVGTVP